MDRNKRVLDLRPVLSNISNEVDTLDVEAFQNKVIRPILKFQHDLLIEIINHYIKEKKVKWTDWDEPTKKKYIQQSLSKDLKLRNVVVGIIVAFMTIEELDTYHLFEAEYRNRIIKMVCQRYLS